MKQQRVRVQLLPAGRRAALQAGLALGLVLALGLAGHQPCSAFFFFFPWDFMLSF